MTEPPDTLARLVANRNIEVLAAGELLFTADESKRVASARVQLGEQTLAALHERSGGWAAGPVLMVEHARSRGYGAAAPMAGTQEAVFDYFAGEIFGRVHPLLANPEITPISHCYWKWAHSNFVLRTGAPHDALR